ncbi:hypothetical protein D5045_08435 [Verminephrobacter eiseniae]|uniref:hypothetical protein n=1 Tax=Verminephrobacter eiseniae TaxID=364317 RepID=UPI0022385023|nr:hypothetical protein [Verminephrobacter eiseniae]MCW5260258.1 hypothetical protein [Verminephrobacter eiseniae]
MSRHRSSVGLRWPSKRIAALHRLPIRSVLAARSLRHLIRDATLAWRRPLPAVNALAESPHRAGGAGMKPEPIRESDACIVHE